MKKKTRCTPKQAIGEFIRRKRKRHKISQTVLGDALELHQAAVCRAEMGEQTFTPEQLVIAGDLLGFGLRHVERLIRWAWRRS